MHFSTSLLIEAVTRAINAHICSAIPGMLLHCMDWLWYLLSLAVPSLSSCLLLVSHMLFGTQQGISLPREVCCEILKASALQVTIILPLENAKGNNVIIHLDLKLYDKTSKAMAAQARGVPLLLSIPVEAWLGIQFLVSDHMKRRYVFL